MVLFRAGPLIPCSRPSMFRIFSKFKDNPDIRWPVKGRPPILSSCAFMKAVTCFEKDEGRAVGKTDMNAILKEAKVDVAKKNGISSLLVISPTKRSQDNYMALLPQLDAGHSKTCNVQKKK